VIFAVIDQGLHRPAYFFGVLSSLQGVGAIVGGVSAPRVLRRLGDAKLVGLGMALFAIGDFSFITGNLALVLIGIAIAGAGVAWLIVGFATAVQTRTPDRLQGRVFSAADTIISTPQTVSIALGAVLITAVDYRVLVVVEAVVTMLCAVYLVTRRIEAAVSARAPSAPSPLPPQPSALPAPDPPAPGTTTAPARGRAASDPR
jgi:MFS family permease